MFFFNFFAQLYLALNLSISLGAFTIYVCTLAVTHPNRYCCFIKTDWPFIWHRVNSVLTFTISSTVVFNRKAPKAGWAFTQTQCHRMHVPLLSSLRTTCYLQQEGNKVIVLFGAWFAISGECKAPVDRNFCEKLAAMVSIVEFALLPTSRSIITFCTLHFFLCSSLKKEVIFKDSYTTFAVRVE